MPELPEAEHARRRLDDALAGRRLERVELRDPTLVPGEDRAGFVRALTGQSVLGTRRHGKHVLVDLDGGATWWLHLGMSGKVVPLGTAAADGERRLRLTVRTDQAGVALRDPRRFGRSRIGPKEAMESLIEDLGPDAWALARDPGALGRALAGRRGTVKSTLLDQGVLAGVGNIQATEALHRAGIHPWTRADDLEPEQHRALARALGEGFAGTLADLEARDGRYLQEGGPSPFRVYGRAGAPCPQCGTPLTSARQAGRATTWCPRCQPAGGGEPARSR